MQPHDSRERLTCRCDAQLSKLGHNAVQSIQECVSEQAALGACWCQTCIAALHSVLTPSDGSDILSASLAVKLTSAPTPWVLLAAIDRRRALRNNSKRSAACNIRFCNVFGMLYAWWNCHPVMVHASGHSSNTVAPTPCRPCFVLSVHSECCDPDLNAQCAHIWIDSMLAKVDRKDDQHRPDLWPACMLTRSLIWT